MFDCLVSSIGETGATLTCTAGYDGGLEQKFYLEVYEDVRPFPTLVTNLTSLSPSFNIVNLRPDTTYNLNLFSANIRGRANKSILLSLTTRAPTPVSPDNSVSPEHHRRDFYGMATITGLVILFLLVMLGLISRYNKYRRLRRIQRKRRREMAKAR